MPEGDRQIGDVADRVRTGNIRSAKGFANEVSDVGFRTALGFVA